MLEALKVKIKTLAAEARIIRKEELAAKQARHYDKLQSLHCHRVGDVRRASRHSHLAYGFLRQVPYLKMEQSCRSQPHWETVRKEAARFSEGSPDQIDERWKAWTEAA